MRILYAMTSLAHKRVFQSFIDRPESDQVVVGPKTIIFDGIVPEGYEEFGISKIIEYEDVSKVQDVVSSFRPDIYVQADMSLSQKKIKLPPKCKRVYVSHGLVGDHVREIKKQLGGTDAWLGCDLYCGGTKIFERFINGSIPNSDKKVLLNAIPQLDIVYDIKNKYNDGLKRKILGKTKNPGPKAVLFFGGFCCKDRIDFWDHNEDYFRSCIELEKLARKNNWLVFVKPRQFYSEMRSFLESNKNRWGGWPKKYISEYADIQNSKFMHFIKTSSGLHYYYAISDVIMINGCSTMEIEAYCVEKPLLVINSRGKTIGFDPFHTNDFGCRYNIDNYNNIEQTIIHSINNPNENTFRQREVLSALGLTIDGKMNERVYDKIRSLI